MHHLTWDEGGDAWSRWAPEVRDHPPASSAGWTPGNSASKLVLFPGPRGCFGELIRLFLVPPRPQFFYCGEIHLLEMSPSHPFLSAQPGGINSTHVAV